MADYNVNMKQWNGTSFDNVLPLAYMANNAGRLNGKTYEEIQTYVKDSSNFDFVGAAVLFPAGSNKTVSANIVVENQNGYVAFLLFIRSMVINGNFKMSGDVADLLYGPTQNSSAISIIYNGNGDYKNFDSIAVANIAAANIAGSSLTVNESNRKKVSDIKLFKSELRADVGRAEVCIFGMKK